MHRTHRQKCLDSECLHGLSTVIRTKVLPLPSRVVITVSTTHNLSKSTSRLFASPAELLVILNQDLHWTVKVFSLTHACNYAQ
jgi:hypothetical protein